MESVSLRFPAESMPMGTIFSSTASFADIEHLIQNVKRGRPFMWSVSNRARHNSVHKHETEIKIHNLRRPIIGTMTVTFGLSSSMIPAFDPFQNSLSNTKAQLLRPIDGVVKQNVSFEQ